MEWKTIDSAPHGDWVEVVKTIGGRVVKRSIHKPVSVITASKCGKVFTSYWMGEEKRWHGYAAKEKPTHWYSMPQHPLTKDQPL